MALLGMAPAAAASGVSTTSILGAAAAVTSYASPIRDDLGDVIGDDQNDPYKHLRQHMWGVRRALDDKMLDFYSGENRMPVNIANKKSWSLAYKHSESRKEFKRLRDLDNQLSNDEFAAKIVKQMFGLE